MDVVGGELQWNPSTVEPQYNKPSIYNKTSLQQTNFARPLVLCYGGPEGSHMQIKNVAAN